MNRIEVALQIMLAYVNKAHVNDQLPSPTVFFELADNFLSHAGVYHRPEAADDVADIFAKYRENIDILHGELRDKELTIATLQKSMDTLAAQLLRADEKAECLERTVADLRKRIQEVTLERDIAWANARRQAPQPPTNPLPEEKL